MNIYDLAEKMHEKQCHWNHIDGCSWQYEYTKQTDGTYKPNWDSWAHKRWLEKAYKVEADTDMPLRDIVKVIEAL